jgi:ATP-binding cassette subfamily B multidrug efflux pump
MDFYHEEDVSSAKLYSRQVMRILFGYVLRYRRQLLVSLFCVAIITAATLCVPYISKVIIDRYIVKQGYVVDAALAAGAHDAELDKRVKGAVVLSGNARFLFQSQLSFFSETRIRTLTGLGVFSHEKYTLIESPLVNERLATHLSAAISRGRVTRCSDGLYLFAPKASGEFTGKELLCLRAHDLSHIGRLVLLMLAVFSIQFVASYAQIVSLMRLSQHSMRDLRRDLFGHIVSLEVSYFDKNPIGRLVNRVTNDIEVLNEMFSSVLITLFQDVLILAGITAVMYTASVYLALCVSITFPLLFIVTFVFRIKARKAYRIIRTKIAEINAFLNENISGIRIVQIFVQEMKQLNKFARINNDVYDANIRQVYVYAIFRPLIDFFRWFAVATVIYIGATLIMRDMVSYGLVIMFLSYIGSFFEPIGDLSEKFDIMQSATAAGEKINGVFNAHAVKETTGGPATEAFKRTHGPLLCKTSGRPDRFAGEIVFDDVWFSYGGDWVLRGVSFCVEPKKTLAIVGETGSGKTTVINLLSRFYRVQKGSILIDGINVNDIPYNIARSNIATVAQDVFLFSRTLRENVILNNPYDEEAFKRVAAITHINKFIRSLKNGDLERVMERGVTFSAGERQLVAFARALYVDPAILVLDEATSSIDTESERLIQDAISHIVKGRTSLVVAHRLSTVQSADRIIVIEGGEIAEQGTHASLLAEKGIYYDLYRMQFEAA